MFYAHTPRASHKSKLNSILHKVGEQPSLATAFRRSLKSYFEKLRRSELLDAQKLWRTLKGNPPADSEFTAILLDYVLEKLESVLGRVEIAQSAKKEILELVLDLKRDLDRQTTSLENPFVALGRGIDASTVQSDVDDVFVNTFFGYRRSSTDGDIIRFYLNIRRRRPAPSKGFVAFTNRYRRGSDRWNVSGGGVFARDRTLYLFGQARDSTKQSKGYRVMALRQLGGSPVLCGPLLSQDKVGPIAARIVLIPASMHKLTEKQQELYGERAVPTRKFINDFIKGSDGRDREEFIEEIHQNVGNCFGPLGEQGLFFYISNLTASVVKGEPTYDDRIIKAEVFEREVCHQNEWKYEDRLFSALDEFFMKPGKGL
ncbi:hypothetical protein [Roseibium polysiphoniae]|uniref:hypothetical protein n=1 Tax=Roseibium polysiphoniae TaxID=2571221 RepID=UPI003299F6BB